MKNIYINTPELTVLLIFSVVAAVSGRDVDIVRSMEVAATARNDVVTARTTDAAVRSGTVGNNTAEASNGTVVKLKTDSPKQQAVLRVTFEDLKNMKELVKTVVKEDNLASAVRLSFHDCVGGCNGCLNIEDRDNAGLGDLIIELETLYKGKQISRFMSRADFWAYAGIYAVNATVEIANSKCNSTKCLVPNPGLVFKTGRGDCATSPYTNTRDGFPGPHLNFSGVAGYFHDKFGFTEQETVALMGVHTIGQAHYHHSGFKGSWVENENTAFNNKYYQILANQSNNWVQNNVGNTTTPQWQWNAANNVGFMLNSDMAIYKEVALSSDGVSSCSYTTCPKSAGAFYVELYAASNAEWIPDFAAVYTKLISHGAVNLQDID